MIRNTIKKILKEDDWDWVNQIPDRLELRPGTIYYAEPPLNTDEAIHFLKSLDNPPYNISMIIKRIEEEEDSTLGYITIDRDGSFSWNDYGGVKLTIKLGNNLGTYGREEYDTVDIGALFRK